MSKLVQIMVLAGFDTKPTLEQLEQLDGIGKVSAAERDAAWKEVQAIKKSEVKQSSKLTHTVTVKKDGFRRLGRAWSGSQDVQLTDEEADVLKADPMFVVVAL